VRLRMAGPAKEKCALRDLHAARPLQWRLIRIRFASGAGSTSGKT
jgi:hypothetical protein